MTKQQHAAISDAHLMLEQHAAPQQVQTPQRKLRATLHRLRTSAVKATRVQHPPVPKRNLTAVLREWHKRAGLFAFVFMGWLGFSGILLNQSVSWGLDAIRIEWKWLIGGVYGLRAEPSQFGFMTAGHWLANTSEHNVLDGKPLPAMLEAPIGLVAGGDAANPLLFIASPGSLLLLTPQGARVDELQASLTLPVRTIRRIGKLAGSGGKVAIEDDKVFASVDGLEWTPVASSIQVNWAKSEPLSADQRNALEPFIHPTMPLEQILIDAHSGRIFGRYGAYVVNAVGLAALLLSISGIWMLWRTSRAQRRRATAR
jgi:hypothetical protein